MLSNIIIKHDIFCSKLKQIIGKEDLSAASPSEIDKVEDAMVRYGLTDIPLTSLNKDKAVFDLLAANVVITRTHALDQFFKGMNATGIGFLLRQFPALSKIILPSPSDVNVDIDLVKENFHVDEEVDTDAKKKAHEWFFKFLYESVNMKCK